MIKILLYSVMAALCLTLSSCKTLHVGLEHAKTSGGFVNSSLTTIGTLYVVDTQDGRFGSMWREEELDMERFPRGTEVSGDRRTELAQSGVSVTFDGPFSDALKADVGARLSRETKIELKQYATERLRSSYSALNSPEARDLRQRLGDQYADNQRYRFVFVYGVTAADTATFTVGNRSDDAENRLYVNVGGQKYEVKFHGDKSSYWEGKKTPVLFEVATFALKTNPKPSGATGYQFFYDASKHLNLTHLFNNRS